MTPKLESREGVATVEVLRGARAATDETPSLLVEVPHGADEAAHFDGLRARLRGACPAGLEAFFWVNTDVGAWAYGRATARLFVEANPTMTALVVRCLLPRTFVDCNRVASTVGGNLAAGGLTACIPSYVHDAEDRALLLSLHAEYVALARAAYEQVAGRGGLALVPHTYQPRSLGIDRVDDDIVSKLHAACDDGREETWPLRPEVDLLTRDGDGKELSPAGAERALLTRFKAAGFAPEVTRTYHLTAETVGYAFSVDYPGRVLCLEVRRDLLVRDWKPLAPKTVDEAKASRIAAVLAPVMASTGR
jgi:hypothetical protein